MEYSKHSLMVLFYVVGSDKYVKLVPSYFNFVILTFCSDEIMQIESPELSSISKDFQ